MISESKYGVKTKCIAVDFTQGLEIYDKIRQEISGFEIGVLGMHCRMFKYIHILIAIKSLAIDILPIVFSLK